MMKLIVLLVVIGCVNSLSLSSMLKINKYRSSLSSLYVSTDDKNNASLFASPAAPTPASMATEGEEGIIFYIFFKKKCVIINY